MKAQDTAKLNREYAFSYLILIYIFFKLGLIQHVLRHEWGVSFKPILLFLSSYLLRIISFPSLCRFLELVRPGDGEEYSKTSFLGARIEKFMFIIITQQWNPPERLMNQTYPIRVIIPSRHDV